MKLVALVAGFASTVVAANWAVVTFGPVPVGFGLLAPAGVYFAGLAFTLRDLVQWHGSKRHVILAIAIGTALSYALGDGRIALAAAAAFALSELVDFAVYTLTRRKGLPAAVAASNVAGLVVDSVVFLALAFGSMAFLPGQVVGKAWVTLLALIPVWLLARRRAVAA